MVLGLEFGQKFLETPTPLHAQCFGWWEERKTKRQEQGKDNSSGSSGSAGKDENEREKNATCFRCGRKRHCKTNFRAKKDSNGKPLDMSTAGKDNNKRSDSKEKKRPEINNGGKGRQRSGKERYRKRQDQ